MAIIGPINIQFVVVNIRTNRTIILVNWLSWKLSFYWTNQRDEMTRLRGRRICQLGQLIICSSFAQEVLEIPRNYLQSDPALKIINSGTNSKASANNIKRTTSRLVLGSNQYLSGWTGGQSSME